MTVLNNYKLLFLPIVLLLALRVDAEVITDGTVGQALSISGPNFQITEDLGSRLGNNLFHSFSNFNLTQNESATFSGADDIQRVISRVTGGQLSSIDGLLQSNIGQADFYFINPAGIFFGQNAQINVPAALHVSTADSLNFSDGTQFNAINPSASTLSVAEPVSFGFSQRTTADIVMDGTQLVLNEQATLNLSGKDIRLENDAYIRIPAGDLLVVATGEEGAEITNTATIVNALGDINFNFSQVDVSGKGGGSISLVGGNVNLYLSDLYNNNTGDKDAEKGISIYANKLYMENAWVNNQSENNIAGNIDGAAGDIYVEVNGDIEMIFGSNFSTSTFSTANAGNIFLQANNVLIDKAGSSSLTGIVSNAQGLGGDAGSINMDISQYLEIYRGAQIGSNSFEIGNAGNVVIQAGDLIIDARNVSGLTGISSQATSNSQGDGGFINLNIDNLIQIYEGGAISSSTFSSGQAGNINIDADQIYIERFNADVATGILSNSSKQATGNAGNIFINARDWIHLYNGGKISSSSFTAGNAANIELNANSLIIDGLGSNLDTGILSDAYLTGNAGTISMNIAQTTAIYDGGKISSDTFDSGNAGNITIKSHDIVLDRLNNAEKTGIFSQAKNNSTGHAGNVNLTIVGDLMISQGAVVSTTTFGLGDAGNINIQSGNILIDKGDVLTTGIYSNAEGLKDGNAGLLQISATGDINILDAGGIGSNTFSLGNAGSITISANALNIDAKTSDSFTGIASQAGSGSDGNAGVLNIDIAGQTSLLNGGKISTNTFAVGNAGNISLSSDNLLIDSQGSSLGTGVFSNAETNSLGHAGNINLSIKNSLDLLSGGVITSTTFGEGNAGNIYVASKNILIDRADGRQTGIISNTQSSDLGNAGTLTINAEQIKILGGAEISSNTFSLGNAGVINLSGDSLFVDAKTSDLFTGVASEAGEGSFGNAGTLNIQFLSSIDLVNGGIISSNTRAIGKAGNITISSPTINIDAKNNQQLSTGVFSNTYSTENGNAGQINLSASQLLQITDGGEISSKTSSAGNAGSIFIQAEQLVVDGKNNPFLSSGIFTNANNDSTGKAGEINIDVNGQIQVLNGSEIGSNTQGRGDAGNVSVHAGSLLIDNGVDGEFFTGIASDTYTNDSDVNPVSGNAGQLSIKVDGLLEIYNDGTISSTSDNIGNAGKIDIITDQLLIDANNSIYTAITSETFEASSGQVGSISINANTISLFNQARIGITAYGNLPSHIKEQNHQIDIHANSLLLSNLSEINAESFGNAAAANININTTGSLNLSSQSSITTAAQNSNAGKISMNNGFLVIDNSLITTSVSNDLGNGGDIAIKSPALVMQSGFVQANTAASGASGGDIKIDTPQLIYPANQLFYSNQNDRIAFNNQSGFNVIQAAAPDGVSGNITLTAPELDLSASILSVSANFIKQDNIGKNPCQVNSGAIPSSLISLGKGGLPQALSEQISVPMGGRFYLQETQLQKVLPTSMAEKLNTVIADSFFQLGCSLKLATNE